MKITVRIPTEQFAYLEAEFDSIEEYETEYPKFALAAFKTRKATKATMLQLKQQSNNNL